MTNKIEYFGHNYLFGSFAYQFFDTNIIICVTLVCTNIFGHALCQISYLNISRHCFSVDFFTFLFGLSDLGLWYISQWVYDLLCDVYMSAGQLGG